MALFLKEAHRVLKQLGTAVFSQRYSAGVTIAFIGDCFHQWIDAQLVF